jgi:hypothetical protein
MSYRLRAYVIRNHSLAAVAEAVETNLSAATTDQFTAVGRAPLSSHASQVVSGLAKGPSPLPMD